MIFTHFSELQEVFLIAFSIFFAIMLQSLQHLIPFKTSTAFKEPAIFYRVLLAVLTLNILPIFYFGIFLLNLGDAPLGLFSIFVVFALCLGVYSFARLFTTIVTKWKSIFYTKEELDDTNNKSEPRLVTLQRHWSQQFYVFQYYLFIPILLYFILKSQYEGIIVMVLLLVPSIIFGIFARKKYMSSLKGV